MPSRLTHLAATYGRHGLTNRTFGPITRADQRAIVEDRWLSRPLEMCRAIHRRPAAQACLLQLGRVDMRRHLLEFFAMKLCSIMHASRSLERNSLKITEFMPS